MLSKLARIFFLLLTVTQISAWADNGMWLPHQITELNLQELGLKINPQYFYREGSPALINAVVSFGGGTGAFVSSQGLILTNHHVAFYAIQRASDVTNDYLKNGFLANSKEQEMPASGTYVDILLGYQEVTNQIVKELRSNMSPRERYDVIEKVSKKLIKEAEMRGPDIRAKVSEIFAGRNYFLYTFKRIRDVRLVYSPPLNLGNFGGEVDNWMWPRHTADFAFFRAYVSTDNIGVEYNLQNIPYKPESILKISLEGIQPGDFTLVMGYPGKTYRQLTLAEFQFAKEQLEEKAAKYEECINFYEQTSQNNRELELKYASKLKSLHNSLKNSRGKLAGFSRMDIDQKKTQQEIQFKNWFESDSKRKKRYQHILEDIRLLTVEKKNNQDKMTILNDWVNFSTGPAILYQAHLLYRTLSEKQKPDIDRDPEFQEREYPSIRNRIRLAERGYDFQIDRSYFLHRLQTLKQLSPEKLPAVFKSLLSSSSNLNSLVYSLYNHSQIQETTKRLEFFQGDLSSLLKIDDPLVNLVAGIEQELKTYRETEKVMIQKDRDLKLIYCQAMSEMTNNQLAPDANSTIRFTYGRVEGYYPQDGIFYLPQTTLKGLLEKDQGEFPFQVPEQIKILHQQGNFGRYGDQKMQDIPVCFLNTTNVTGGSSGSPVVNDHGELTGLVFDMTYESIIGDYYIIPEYQRTINVDVRYILFITEKFSGATQLIQELGL
jgi:hypothetical protein